MFKFEYHANRSTHNTVLHCIYSGKKCGHAVMIYADGLMVVHRNLANRTQICTTIYIVQMRHFSFRASEPTYGWPPAAEATGKNNRSQGDLARRIQERA